MRKWTTYWFLLAVFGLMWILGACSNHEDNTKQAPVSQMKNVEVAKTMYETLLAGDMEGAFNTMAGDIRWLYYGGEGTIPFAGSYLGHEGVAQFFSDFSSVAEPMDMELQTFSESGDTVFVTGIETSKILSTGKTYAAPWVHVLKFTDGKIVSYEEYIDSALVAAAFE